MESGILGQISKQHHRTLLVVPDLLLVLEQPLVPRGLRLEVRLDGVKVLAVLVERLEERRLRTLEFKYFWREI